MFRALTPLFISPGLENALYAVLGSVIMAVIGGIGYLVKRKVEQKPKIDALEISERVVRLLKEISTQDLSVEEFHRLQERILNPRTLAGSGEPELRAQLVELVSVIQGMTDMTTSFKEQSRVHHRLAGQNKQAEKKLLTAYDELLGAHYDRDDFKGASALIKEHKEWREECTQRLNERKALYEDSGVGWMFYLAESTELAAERAEMLAARKRELEERGVDAE